MKFVVERAELVSFPQEISIDGKASDRGTAYHLGLCQGKDFWADREFQIFLTLKAGEKLDGQSFTVRRGVANTRSTGSGADIELLLGVDGVHMSWRPAKAVFPETVMFDTTFHPTLSLRLQFGRRRQDGALPGEIYLCLPDKEQSFVAGTFLIAKKDQTNM